MEKTDKTIYVIVFIFALLTLSGFYFLFNKISGLETNLKNFELSRELPINTPENNSTSVEIQNDKNENEQKQVILQTPEKKESAIPTAILFNVSSSPLLLPQAQITIMIESVSKTEDGTVKIIFKAITSEASSYSALEPQNLFEIVNLTGDNLKPVEVKGKFNSLPPNTSTNGEIVFKISPGQNAIILQIGEMENLKFYEFNFQKNTYKETAIG